MNRFTSMAVIVSSAFLGLILHTTSAYAKDASPAQCMTIIVKAVPVSETHPHGVMLNFDERATKRLAKYNCTGEKFAEYLRIYRPTGKKAEAVFALLASALDNDPYFALYRLARANATPDGEGEGCPTPSTGVGLHAFSVEAQGEDEEVVGTATSATTCSQV